MTVRLLSMGPAAVLVEGLADPTAWSIAVRRLALAGVVDVVPAATTVLVRCNDPEALAAASERLRGIAVPDPVPVAENDLIEIRVTYDGEDLATVAEATGRTVDDVVELHAGATYHVAFCGFAPGFGYLRGLPDELHLPRRATPRQRVPAGAVAIAAGYSAVYPGDSPGGWHLLGRTDVRLFDPDRDPPAILQPGATVRFVPR